MRIVLGLRAYLYSMEEEQKNPVGRPPLVGGEPMQRINTTIPRSIVAYLRSRFGSVAAGIRALVSDSEKHGNS